MIPKELVDGVVAWLVAIAGDAGLAVARGSPNERMLNQAVSVAIDRVVAQVHAESREPLRDALAWSFSTAPKYEPDGATRVDAWLRAAVTAQLTSIDAGGFPSDYLLSQHGWLEEELTAALAEALRQVVAANGVIELVHGMDFADIMTRLNSIGVQVDQLARSSPAAQIHALAGVASTGSRSANQQVVATSGASATRILARRQDWVSAILSFSDTESPEFRLDVLQMMGEALGLGHPFEVAYRSTARDHVNQIITRCKEFAEPDLACTALVRALVMLRPDTRAAHAIQDMLIQTIIDGGHCV